jgi:hypothetical protein
MKEQVNCLLSPDAGGLWSDLMLFMQGEFACQRDKKTANCASRLFTDKDLR